MYRLSLAILALSATTGAALAQAYPSSAYYPPYNQPYYSYYPQYGAAPAAPAYGYYYYPSPYDPHTGGGTSRAYWGGQKTN
jgi:hypothetical protein